MSMLCSLYRLTAEQANAVQSFPDAASELLGYEPPVPKVSFLSKVFGKHRKEATPSRAKFQPISESETFDLHQAWHVLHYLFTGSAEEGKWPGGFIMSGGQELGPDLGYGAPRLLTPEQLKEVAAFLNTQSLQTLDAACISQDIDAAQVYWRVSSDPTDRQRQVEELWDIVQQLRTFIGQLAQTGNSALVYIY
jgi:hypothetical protein